VGYRYPSGSKTSQGLPQRSFFALLSRELNSLPLFSCSFVRTKDA
jgi:hypothetical protein